LPIAVSAAALRRSHQIAEDDMNEMNSNSGLRRTWFRGVRKEDVDRAFEELVERNRELESELVDAQESRRMLIERVTAAEDTLVTFHATLEHIGTLLSLAEQRARQIEQDAGAEAARIRNEAEERVREADAEVAELRERKQKALEALVALRSSLPDESREPALAVPRTTAEVHALPAPERVTVADLLAIEANARL
jgi:chromosome segregation ATPase